LFVPGPVPESGNIQSCFSGTYENIGKLPGAQPVNALVVRRTIETFQFYANLNVKKSGSSVKIPQKLFCVKELRVSEPVHTKKTMSNPFIGCIFTTYKKYQIQCGAK